MPTTLTPRDTFFSIYVKPTIIVCNCNYQYEKSYSQSVHGLLELDPHIPGQSYRNSVLQALQNQNWLLLMGR